MKAADTARPESKEELLRRFRTEEILSAAREVIGRKGIHGASLERIAAEAGVAKGTIYLYFESKEDLLCRVLEDWHRRLLVEIELASSGNGPPSRRLHAVVMAHLDFMSGQRELAHSHFLEDFFAGGKIPASAARRLRAIQKKYVGIVARIIEEGIREGEFRNVNARGAAAILLEMLHGKHQRAVLDKESADPEASASEILDLYFHGVTR